MPIRVIVSLSKLDSECCSNGIIFYKDSTVNNAYIKSRQLLQFDGLARLETVTWLVSGRLGHQAGDDLLPVVDSN
jgi:hypothetical protein